MSRKNFQRAILFGIVLFSFSARTIVVKSKPQPAETFKDIILKSKNLTLQNDRMQALNVLSTSITKETPKSVAQLELKKTLREISSLFLSDRAQQLYELAISMKRADPQAAMSQLLDAQRLEPDNFLIMTEIVRLQIIKGDCGAAKKELGKYGKFKTVSEELLLVNLQAAICLGEQKSIDENKAFIGGVKSTELQLYWKAIDLELAGVDIKKMNQLVEELAKIDSHYPELEFWRWKLDVLNKKQTSIAGDKYLLLCKNLSSSKFRQYMMDPNLCKRVKDVEKSEN